MEFPERLTNFYVFVSDVPFTSTNLTTTLNQASVSNYLTAGQCGFPTELAINRTGRYVRVQLAGTNYLSIAELQVWTPGSSAPPVQWLISDHLGTPRMVMDQTGSQATMKRHDYLPFGEELVAPTSGRNAAQGYAGGDGVRQQFTANERDTETSLDYFGARYYAALQGRFTGVDPLSVAPHLNGAMKRPQAWNAYSYAINNPLKYWDPNGLRWAQRELSDGSTEFMWFDTDEAYNAAIDSSSETYQGWVAVTFDETKPYTITTRHQREECLAGVFCNIVELAQLNPDGEVETSVNWFSDVDLLVDLGTNALFGKKVADAFPLQSKS